jgi:hypothetical protein
MAGQEQGGHGPPHPSGPTCSLLATCSLLVPSVCASRLPLFLLRVVAYFSRFAVAAAANRGGSGGPRGLGPEGLALMQFWE